MISKAVNGFSDKDLVNFQLGLYATAIRGLDSTGTFYVKNNGNVSMIKSIGPSADFIRKSDYTEWENHAYLNGRIMVGHCRAATKGEKTDLNAHPFISDNIILVHNGTLWAHKHLADTVTDSEAIAVSFSKNDPKEIIPDLDGAFALLWYDAKHKTFHASRNKERPLWILQTPTLDFIGSEPGMLEWIHNRCYPTKINAQYFETDKIFSWDLDNLQDSFTETPLKKKHPITITPFSSQTHTNTGVTNKKILLFDNYFYGDRIKLNIISNTQTNNTIYLEGIDPNNPSITFKCYLNSVLKEKKEVLEADTIYATISGKQQSVDNIIIFVTNPEPVTEKTDSTIELEDINEKIQIIDIKDCYCSRCNAIINKQDSKKVWFRIKNGVVKSLYCPHCVKHNINLKVIK